MRRFKTRNAIDIFWNIILKHELEESISIAATHISKTIDNICRDVLRVLWKSLILHYVSSCHSFYARITAATKTVTTQQFNSHN